MPHRANCTDKSELGIDDEGNDFCLNCGQIVKPEEDQFIIQEKFLAEGVEKITEIKEQVKTNPRKAIDDLGAFGESMVEILSDEKRWDKEFSRDLLLIKLNSMPRERIEDVSTFIEENIQIKSEYYHEKTVNVSTYIDGYYMDSTNKMDLPFIFLDGFGHEAEDHFPNKTIVTCKLCKTEIITKSRDAIDLGSDRHSISDKTLDQFFTYLIGHYIEVHYKEE